MCAPGSPCGCGSHSSGAGISLTGVVLAVAVIAGVTYAAVVLQALIAIGLAALGGMTLVAAFAWWRVWQIHHAPAPSRTIPRQAPRQALPAPTRKALPKPSRKALPPARQEPLTGVVIRPSHRETPR